MSSVHNKLSNSLIEGAQVYLSEGHHWINWDVEDEQFQVTIKDDEPNRRGVRFIHVYAIADDAEDVETTVAAFSSGLPPLATINVKDVNGSPAVQIETAVFPGGLNQQSVGWSLHYLRNTRDTLVKRIPAGTFKTPEPEPAPEPELAPEPIPEPGLSGALAETNFAAPAPDPATVVSSLDNPFTAPEPVAATPDAPTGDPVSPTTIFPDPFAASTPAVVPAAPTPTFAVPEAVTDDAAVSDVDPLGDLPKDPTIGAITASTVDEATADGEVPPPATIRRAYVHQPVQVLHLTSYQPVSQLQPGVWYLALESTQGWLHVKSDDGAIDGWAAENAVLIHAE